jgi:integrase-like protein
MPLTRRFAAWQRIPETAARLRSRIEKVLDAAGAKGYRERENPAGRHGLDYGRCR